MGCRVLHDANEDLACFYDSVTGQVFGRLLRKEMVHQAEYHADEVAEAFFQFVRAGGTDLRQLTPLEFDNWLDRFRTAVLPDAKAMARLLGEPEPAEPEPPRPSVVISPAEFKKLHPDAQAFQIAMGDDSRKGGDD